MNKLQLIATLLIAILIASCTNSVEVNTKDDFERVTLPDGSVAFINKNSSIKYTQEFSPRTIVQTGEVFYNVVPGTQPFIVETANGSVKVLGTEFNVKETQDDIEVEVEKGSVELKVDEMVEHIKKGQKVICHKADKHFKRLKAEWKHNDWMNDMQKEFKKLGKEWDKNMDHLQDESKKAGKEIKKGFEKLKDKIKD